MEIPTKSFAIPAQPKPTLDILDLITPTSTLADGRINRVDEKCIPVSLEPNDSLDKLKNGVLIIDDYDNSLVYALDIESKKNLFTNKQGALSQGHNMMMSPNHQLLAYTRTDQNRDEVLEIINALGQQEGKFVLTGDMGLMREWLDNEQLLVQKTADEHGTMFVINPFQRTSQTLTPSFSNLYQGDHPAFWSPSYDSSLSFVLFPNGRFLETKEGYSLWDNKDRKLIWQQPSRTASRVSPEWAPVRNMFAVIVDADESGLKNQSEIHVVKVDGKVAEQTTLTLIYPYVYISDFISWSPDGNYLAF